jgi:hypothetical protein
MHRTVIAFAAASIALAAPVLAQSSYAAAGAQFEARLDRALDTKTMHDGDRFTLTEDATFYRAAPPALKRAKIEGHVEHVTPPRKDHRATLNVVFDDVVLADGTTAPIDATITQIGSRDPRTHGLRESGVVLGGRVAGHRNVKKPGMAEGAPIAPGTGVALSSRDPKKPVEVKRGTIVRLKLLEPITTVG